MIPPRLKKGDKIAITAPSQPQEINHRELIQNAVKVLEGFGLKVVMGKTTTLVDKFGVSAGTPEERANEVNSLFADTKIKGIWCGWGGDTANEIIDKLDFDLIKKNPKIVTGLSDNTLLINTIYKETGLITFHGTDIKVGNKDEYFDSKYSQDEFVARFIEGRIGDVKRISKWRSIREGRAKGRIFGGNLPAILKAAGTRYFPNYNNSILILEGYHTRIRDAVFQLTHLKQAGVFDQIAGIVVGYIYSFQKEKQFNSNSKRIFLEEIVLDLTKDYTFPILKINEFGHKCPSTFLPIGGMGEMDAGKKSFKIIEKCVK